ncbi:hypothetical protein QPK31_21065 [Massilia sp. YIM B02769]|jgi:hypothetical protein|uniref:hypothetical protein n=1 Tax=Massilia sp. YIM B02769 TaxID=3050129 RepID=UPI0025B6D520|nr:hypothetical protein [Massilia sp. YIM B02769]MDN4060707.1 hypothetical protein [Massilia sp. YIM B02769]
MNKNMLSLVRRVFLLPAVVAVATLTGCASQITNQELTPAPVAVAKQHAGSVTVTALPAPNADAAAAAADMAELRTAVSNAITASRAFAEVKGNGGDYQLTVQVFSVNSPAFGISMTSKVEMGWTLKRADTGAVVWQQSINTEHTTGGGEAFVGAERVKMSIAGAIKKNIAQGVERIGAAAF